MSESAVETTQMRIRLTNDKRILNQMRKNKALATDKRGDVFRRQFDSKVFEFRPGQTLTVGHRVGNALIRDSAIILDNHLTGEMVPCIEKLSEYELGLEIAPEEKSTPTTCPVCKQNCFTLPRLARHLLSKHKEDRADLFEAEDTATEKEVRAEVGEDNEEASE